MSDVSPEVLATMRREIDMMTGPEADALLVELRETVLRKLQDDRYKGNHSAAFGAACRLVLSLIRDIGASEGQQARLQALAVGMFKRGWDDDQENPNLSPSPPGHTSA
jgi:hypothetical protein